jgi:uncharacterized membrane protein
MYYMHDGGWVGGSGGGWGWGVAMMLGMVALVALAFCGVFWLMCDRRPRTHTTPAGVAAGTGLAAAAEPVNRETPIEILERRLASGELNVAEYEERRGVLEREPRSGEGGGAVG